MAPRCYSTGCTLPHNAVLSLIPNVREVFERSGQRAILDTRYLDDRYEIHLIYENGVESVAYCVGVRDVVERQIALNIQLARDGWTRKGTPKL